MQIPARVSPSVSPGVSPGVFPAPSPAARPIGESGPRHARQPAASMARLGLLALFGLSACTTTGADPETGFMKELPEPLVELAAPGQDLSAVRLDPADGCFWYRYDGYVEVTMLPVLTREGRPICTRAKDG